MSGNNKNDYGDVIGNPDDGAEPDMVNNPSHYTQGPIQCIDAIQAALTPEEFKGYIKGVAIKYLWREKHKGKTQDLAKAQWYLKHILLNGEGS